MVMDEGKIVDGIRIINDKNPREVVIFNFHTWVEIIAGLMVKYGGKNEVEAKTILLESPLVENALKNYMAVVLRAHEVDYHWAMLYAHGEGYWLRGIDTNEPEDYKEWDAQYRKDRNLKAESFEFDDDAPT